MKYHELQTNTPKRSQRVGRGIAAGKGKTAGRGTKGQNSRTGGGVRPGFEGGQNPVYFRMPKLPGFRSIRPKAEVIYTSQLDDLAGKNIDNEVLFAAGLVSSPHVKTKLIVKGQVTKKVSLNIQSASKEAVAQIEKAGGTFKPIERVARIAKKKADAKE